MDNKNISTKLGVGIIVIFSITVLAFVMIWNNNHLVDNKEASNVNPNIDAKEKTTTYKYVKFSEDGQWTVEEVALKDWQKPLSVELAEDESMTWKDYGDEKLGIKFKYPQYWDVSNNEEKISLYIKVLADARDYMENTLHNRIEIFPGRASIKCTHDEKEIADMIKRKNIFEKGASLDVSNNEMIEFEGSFILNTQKTNIEIGDKNPIIFYDYLDGDGAGHFAEAFWEKNGLYCKALMLGASAEGLPIIEQTGRTELFKKILATFRFTK